MNPQYIISLFAFSMVLSGCNGPMMDRLQEQKSYKDGIKLDGFSDPIVVHLPFPEPDKLEYEGNQAWLTWDSGKSVTVLCLSACDEKIFASRVVKIDNLVALDTYYGDWNDCKISGSLFHKCNLFSEKFFPVLKNNRLNIKYESNIITAYGIRVDIYHDGNRDVGFIKFQMDGGLDISKK